jgi:hypothetical protein
LSRIVAAPDAVIRGAPTHRAAGSRSVLAAARPPMKALIEAIRDVCLLRRGPQDLPYSPALLHALAALSFVISLAVASRLAEVGALLLPLAVALGALIGLPYLALKLAGREARFVQTAIALLGCDVLFTLLYVPVAFGIGELPEQGQQMTGVQRLLALLSLGLIAWQLAVRGHILRHALELPMRVGLLVAVVFFAIEYVVSTVFWPTA